MLDIKWIRENSESFDNAMKNRSNNIKAAELIKIDDRRKEHLTKIQELQSQRNSLAMEIAKIKKSGGDSASLMDQSKKLMKTSKI